SRPVDKVVAQRIPNAAHVIAQRVTYDGDSSEHVFAQISVEREAIVWPEQLADSDQGTDSRRWSGIWTCHRQVIAAAVPSAPRGRIAQTQGPHYAESTFALPPVSYENRIIIVVRSMHEVGRIEVAVRWWRT